MRAIEHITIDVMIPIIKRTEAKTGVRGREASLVPSTVGTEPVEGGRGKRRGREEGGGGREGGKEGGKERGKKARRESERETKYITHNYVSLQRFQL